MIDEKKMEMLEARFLKNPKSILFARLADYYLQQNRVDEAVNLCKEGVKYHPYYITGNFILGKAYIAANEFDKAEEALKKVLSHDRQHLAAHGLLAELMIKLGWENKAAVHYKEILKIDPLNGEARQALNNLTGYEIEHEEPPPIVSDAEEDSPSSNPQTHSSADDKPWMKKLEEAFPKPFSGESETPRPEIVSAPPEEMTEKISMESLISEAETLIDKNSKPKMPAKPSDNIRESETKNVSSEDQAGQAVEQEEKDESFFKEEESLEETVKEEDLFEGIAIEPEQQITQDKKEEIKEKEFFEPFFPESEQDVNRDARQKTADENLFEGTNREPGQEQPREEEDEIFFHPMTPDSELTIAQLEQQAAIKKEDLFEAPLEKPAHKKSIEKKAEPEEEEIFFEPLIPETEETQKVAEKKTKKKFPEKKSEKHKKESAAFPEDKTSDQGIETEEAGFFIEVTKPESPLEDKVEKTKPAEPEKSGWDEKIMQDDRKEKSAPQIIEEKPELKTPEPELKTRDKEPMEPKNESPPENKKKTKIMTPTLGEIYLAQGQFEKAVKVYENLLEKTPDNKQYQEKIEELKKKLKDAK